MSALTATPEGPTTAPVIIRSPTGAGAPPCDPHRRRPARRCARVARRGLRGRGAGRLRVPGGWGTPADDVGRRGGGSGAGGRAMTATIRQPSLFPDAEARRIALCYLRRAVAFLREVEA